MEQNARTEGGLREIRNLLSDHNMTSFQVLCVALYLLAFTYHSSTVDGSIIKSMYINWGAQHTAIQGDNLALVLDQSSGKYHF